MEYYESRLSKAEVAIYHSVADAIRKYQAQVYLGTNTTVESFQKIMQAIQYDMPELFYVDFRKLSYLNSSSGLSYNISYLYSLSQTLQIQQQIEHRISEILSSVQLIRCESDYQKCRFVHNLFVKTLHYNYQALKNPSIHYESYNIVGVFINRTAVCLGISKAFKLVCHRLHIPSLIISGSSWFPTSASNVKHAWNIVKLSSGLTHIDVTWDLGVINRSGFYCYDYLFLADREIRLDHEYRGYPPCNLSINYFEKTNNSVSTCLQLQSLVQNAFPMKKVIYFKVIHDSPLDQYSHDDVCNIVTETLSDISRHNVSLRFIINKTQRTYYVTFVNV